MQSRLVFCLLKVNNNDANTSMFVYFDNHWYFSISSIHISFCFRWKVRTASEHIKFLALSKKIVNKEHFNSIESKVDCSYCNRLQRIQFYREMVVHCVCNRYCTLADLLSRWHVVQPCLSYATLRFFSALLFGCCFVCWPINFSYAAYFFDSSQL